MKRLILSLILIVLLPALSCCAAQLSEEAAVQPAAPEIAPIPAEDLAELAFVPNTDEVEGSYFHGAIWEGLKRFADGKGISRAYYPPEEQSVPAYTAAIDKAVELGAKFVICVGQPMEPAVFEAQYKYPEIYFLLLDGQPRSADFTTYAIEDNVCSVFFAEQQAGFLAGYAAVKNGYSKLGFIGGMAVPSVVRYGYGYVAGAAYAAEEDNKNGIEIMYNYSGSFLTTQAAQTLAGTWYNNGIQLIFNCGCGDSAILAAEAAAGEVIGADTDQSAASDTVVVSAMKMLGVVVNNMLKNYYDGNFQGGVTKTLTAADNAIGLSMDSLRFSDFGADFTTEQYTTIFTKLSLNEIIPPTENSYASAAELSNERITVTVVE